MHFPTIIASAVMAAVATAQTVHVVSVGSTETDRALTFSPNKIEAAQGDMVQFQFRAGNHTLTQSTFDQPCAPIGLFTNATGIYSGFQPVAASEAMGMIPTYTISVANTNPMWFYCSQGRHCQNGMVMVINENTQGNSTRSLENFSQLAQAATNNLAGDATSIDDDATGQVDAGDVDGDGDDIQDLPLGAGSSLTIPTMMSAIGVAAYLLL